MIDDRFALAAPYLLFLGDVSDARRAKTASGVYYWRPELCLGQLRLPGCAADLGLPDLTAQRRRSGARGACWSGLPPSGGQIPRQLAARLRQRPAGRAGSGLGNARAALWRVTLVRPCEAVRRQDHRCPPCTAGLPVGNGRRRAGKRLLTVGTDCGVGKMFAALALEREMVSRGMRAEFRATGQTGIMIAGRGICVDAVVSDFTAGAAETLAPENDPHHWDIIEGQGSLFHPSFAGVTLSLLHGSQPD